MTTNLNFEQQLNAELNKQLGLGVSEPTSPMSPDEFATVAPLLDLAEKLRNTRTPTLSASAQARIEAQLHNYVATHPIKPTRIQRLPRWQLLVAGLALILGLGVAFSLLGGEDDKPVEITQISHLPAETKSATSSSPYILDGTTAEANPVPPVTYTPMSWVENGVDIVKTPGATRDVDLTGSDGVVACANGVNYWTNNYSNWTITSLQIGENTYNQAELLDILEAVPDEDASLFLARALIIAQLNGYSETELAEADQLLQDYTGKLPFAVDTTGALGREMISIANALLPHTANCVTVTPIDVNNTTNPDNNGDGAGNNGGNPTPDNCKNPPPEHANANGWRERCENGGSNGNSGNNSGNNGNNGNNK